MPPQTPTRRPTYPLAQSSRRKPRRLPLVLRFSKGSIHNLIIIPVILHSLFTALIVYLSRNGNVSLGLPPTIIPSLSIVVGLMLVFRNQTSYDRFWTGRNCLTTIGTSVRNLARVFLVNARPTPSPSAKAPEEGDKKISDIERADTERTIRVLIAVLYAVKNNLRAEFNIPPASLSSGLDAVQDRFHDERPRPITRNSSHANESGLATPKAEYVSLLPDGLVGYEDQGLGLPLQLTVLLEGYIRRGIDRGWFNGPMASQMTVQLNSLVDAYGRMETIRTTPIPVAHLIHQRQVLALFVCVLPFATVDDFGWWAVPIVAIVAFTLYGIEGIGVQLEDPFGYDKNDIKMEGIIEDTRQEVFVLLEEWKARGEGREGGYSGMFD